MKIRTGSIVQKAIREFTDREEPRAAFWKKYQEIEAEMCEGGECSVHVLSYYGIGGIGKTRLLKQLQCEMDEKTDGPLHVYFDFQVSQESRRTLERIKNKLAEMSNFVFPLFELGLFVYAKKVGEKADSPDVKQLTDKSPLLKLLVSIADNIPVLGIASKVLSLADQSIAYIRNHLKTHSTELARIEYMEPEDLYKYLPMLFAFDMQHNMRNAKKPVVILLDTYERLVNELSQIGDPLKNDEWLRGDEGIIPRVPGVLWVIAGREKLKWERFDPEWEGALEQHILGSLSETDSKGFLEKAGVGGEGLRDSLYQLTGGTPVYLDLCVDQFMRIVEKGETPKAEMFGKDTYELIERFVRYMGDAQKDNVYMLACLRVWTDELIDGIAPTVLPNFSITAFEKTKDFSFIIKTDEKYYNIHQTVGEVLMSDCPRSIRERTGKALMDRYSESVQKQEYFTSEFADALAYVMRGALLYYTDREELREYYEADIQSPLQELIDAGKLQPAKAVLDMLNSTAEENKADRLYATVLIDKAYFERSAGNFTDALRYDEEALSLRTRLLGEDHPDTITATNNKAAMLGYLGRHEEALEKHQEVLDKRSRILGEDHPDTITAMNNLAVTLGYLGRHEEALEKHQEVLDKRSRILGEDHPDTIRAMSNLASTIGYLGRHEEALEIEQEVLDKRSRILGEDHPDTITAMSNLAVTLGELGRYEEALDLLKKIASLRKKK